MLKFNALALLTLLTSVQILQPFISLTTNNQAVEAATATTKANSNSTTASEAQKLVNYCWNSSYISVRKNGGNSWGFYSKEIEELNNINDALSVFIEKLYTNCNMQEGKGKLFGSQVQTAALGLFNKYTKPLLYKTHMKAHGNEIQANLAITVWSMAIELFTYAPSILESGGMMEAHTSNSKLAAASVLYPKILALHKANLRLQTQGYKSSLAYYRANANENGLNQVYYGLEALHRDLEAKGEFRMLPVENIGGGGSFNLPVVKFQPDPARFLPANFSAKLDKELKAFKYQVVVPELIEEATSSILYLEQVKGLDRLNSFNYLMAELGLELLLGVLETPTPKLRSALSSIPESELRAGATRTSNPKRANALVDDVKGKKGGSGSSGNNPIDDVDNAKRPNLECVAFNPDAGTNADKPQFSLALAKSITKSKSLLAQTLQESGARVVSDAPMSVAGLGSEFNAPEFSGRLLLVSRTCADAWNQATKFEYGKKSLQNSLEYLNKLDDLTIQPKKISAGRSGKLSQEFVGEPNSIYATASDAKNRIVVTDSTGRAVLDIDTGRIKIYYDFKDPQYGIVRRNDFKLPEFDSSGNPLATERKTPQALVDLIERVNKIAK